MSESPGEKSGPWGDDFLQLIIFTGICPDVNLFSAEGRSGRGCLAAGLESTRVSDSPSARHPRPEPRFCTTGNDTSHTLTWPGIRVKLIVNLTATLDLGDRDDTIAFFPVYHSEQDL
jgi:hypothetical protein